MFRRIGFLSLLSFVLIAKEGYLPPHAEHGAPWFTGPLLAPSGNVVPAGQYNIEPYLYATANTANYNNNWDIKEAPTSWNFISQNPIQIGVLSWLDVGFTPQFSYNYDHHAAHWALNDMVTQADIQLYLNPTPLENLIPSVRMTIRETVPLGKYRNLNPKKKGTDQGGGGAWVSGMGFVFSKLIHIHKAQFLNSRFSLGFSYPAPVHVKGFNSYGGGFGTNGTVYPPLQAEFDLGMEYSVAQGVAFAIDVVGSWTSKSRFTGHAGADALGHPAINTQKTAFQFSLAPAFEYNWNANLGIIAGYWFTIAGRNSTKFSSGVVAINYYK
jgi:hypothetical protein